MGEHRKRTRPSTKIGARAGIAVWSLVCTVAGAGLGLWAPSAVSRVEAVLGVDTLAVDAAYAESECGPGPMTLAGIRGAPTPDEVIRPEEGHSLPMPTPGDSEQLVPFERATIGLSLETKTDEVVFVRRIVPVIFDESEVDVEWAVWGDPGCGGELSNRHYSVDLDGRPLEMEPLQPMISTGFTVSRNDPSEVLVEFTGCQGYYEFGIELEYSVRDVVRTVVSGTREDPFAIAAGRPARFYELFDGRLSQQPETIPCVEEGFSEPEGKGGAGPLDPTFEAVAAACKLVVANLTLEDQLALGCFSDAPDDFEGACARAAAHLTQEQLDVLACTNGEPDSTSGR